jgi:hypothetical protein
MSKLEHSMGIQLLGTWSISEEKLVSLNDEERVISVLLITKAENEVTSTGFSVFTLVSRLLFASSTVPSEQQSPLSRENDSSFAGAWLLCSQPHLVSSSLIPQIMYDVAKLKLDKISSSESVPNRYFFVFFFNCYYVPEPNLSNND